MNTKADAAFVEKGDFDCVIAAVGSSPITPDFGTKNRQLLATELLNGKVQAGSEVVVIGGGLVGCETALWLRQMGKSVTVIEMMPDILGGPHGMPFMNYDMLKHLLAYNGVEVLTSTKVTSIEENGVAVENASGIRTIPADSVVLAIGFRSRVDGLKEIEALPVKVYRIGDCRHVSNIMHAVWDGYEVARSI